MPVNRRRGEVAAVLDGRERRLCLTLGALAELEDAFRADTISALAERFGAGTLSSRDLVRILGAGLRGGGNEITDDEVARMAVDGGAAGAACVAAELLAAAFGEIEGEGEPRPSGPPRR